MCCEIMLRLGCWISLNFCAWCDPLFSRWVISTIHDSWWKEATCARPHLKKQNKQTVKYSGSGRLCISTECLCTSGLVFGQPVDFSLLKLECSLPKSSSVGCYSWMSFVYTSHQSNLTSQPKSENKNSLDVKSADFLHLHIKCVQQELRASCCEQT